ncbi:hypothetical protein [Kribbella sp. VKM Ac-2571]|nr:hypothetical protein [Kribbella sp. VKM Ac-2571]
MGTFGLKDSGAPVRLAFTGDGDQVNAQWLVARRTPDRELAGP